WPCYLGLAILAATSLAIAALIRGWVPSSHIFTVLPPTLAVGLIGAVLAFPLLLPLLLPAVGRALRPVLGLEGRLAVRQLQRHPARTSLTAAVLLIAVVISIGFGQSLWNNVRDIHKWTAHTISRDFYVRGNMPDTTTTITAAPLPATLDEQLGALDGVAQVDRVTFIQARAQGRPVVLLGFTFAADVALPFSLVAGEPEEVRRR